MSNYDLAEDIRNALYLSRASASVAGSAVEESTDAVDQEDYFAFDSHRDCKYSAPESATFDRTVFLFTQQWVGIRQSCGAFPVSKLCIDGYHQWTIGDIMAVCRVFDERKIERVVSHGMAPSTKSFLSGLKACMPELEILGVWHGTMAGWAFEHELRLFQDMVDLVEENVISKVGFLRRGMGDVHQKAWKVGLLNVPPFINGYRVNKAFSSKPINCLFGSWNNQWKNMFTNLVGASNCGNVRNIVCYQSVKCNFIGKIEEVKHGSFDEHMARLSISDLCLNVSINDCQPMTELEGIAVGTPSLRPNLDHKIKLFKDYEDLFTVDEYLNPNSITKAIDRLCSIDSSHINQVVTEYGENIRQLSYQRYADFFYNRI